MTKIHRPIRTSLLWGLLCGLLFFPLNFVLSSLISWSSAICLTFWLFLAGYAFVLSKWSKRKFLSSAFPLMFLCLSIFLVKSITAFFLLSLIVTSWIRSGIYFQGSVGIKLSMEILLCAIGGILITIYTPSATFSGGLVIWMFFLVQTLYFIIFDTSVTIPKETFTKDPFEHASKCAEDILSNFALV